MLSQATVQDLATMTDEFGVLSVYSTSDPREEAAPKPARRLRLDNELKSLRKRVENGDKNLRNAVHRRLEALEPELNRLLDASEFGVGRALFATVGRDEVRTITLQLPLGDLAVLEPTAYLRPLVNAATEGAPAGVLAVSRDGLRVIDTRYGLADEAEGYSFDIATEEWRRLQGPARPGPRPSARSSAQGDLFDRRVEDHRIRSLVALAPDIEAKAKELDWETIVIAGDPRYAEAVAASLPGNGNSHGNGHGNSDLPGNGGRQIVLLDHVVDPAVHASELARVAEPAVREARTRRARSLAERARDAALSGGLGTVGLGDTLGALQEGGRVRYLLLEESCEWAGRQAPDGRLYPLDETPAGASGSTMTEVGDLGEHMIELAIAGGAGLATVNAEAAEVLAVYDGIAALLRW